MKVLKLAPLLLLFFTSCKKENNIKTDLYSNNSTASNSKVVGDPIVVEGDYLSFRDGEIFKSTIAQLEKMSNKERITWERQFDGFQSMDAKFEENSILDTLHFWRMQYVEHIPQNATVHHCDEIRDSKFMYVKYFFDRVGDKYEEYTNESVNNGEYFLLKNINYESNSYVVNPHGIVKIGNTLYQFTHEWIKSKESGTPANVNQLINARPNAGGVVEFHSALQDPVIDQEVQAGCDIPAYWQNNMWSVENTSEFSNNPKLRIFISGKYRILHNYYCPALFSPNVLVDVRVQKKSWYNLLWQDDFAEMTLEVSYTSNFPNGSTANRYSYGTANGQWTQYGLSETQINSQAFGSMFYITNFYARATRNGGSSGGAVTISH